jgi:hypothetical protein
LRDFISRARNSMLRSLYLNNSLSLFNWLFNYGQGFARFRTELTGLAATIAATMATMVSRVSTLLSVASTAFTAFALRIQGVFSTAFFIAIRKFIGPIVAAISLLLLSMNNAEASIAGTTANIIDTVSNWGFLLAAILSLKPARKALFQAITFITSRLKLLNSSIISSIPAPRILKLKIGIIAAAIIGLLASIEPVVDLFIKFGAGLSRISSAGDIIKILENVGDAALKSGKYLVEFFTGTEIFSQKNINSEISKLRSEVSKLESDLSKTVPNVARDFERLNDTIVLEKLKPSGLREYNLFLKEFKLLNRRAREEIKVSGEISEATVQAFEAAQGKFKKFSNRQI